MAAMSSSGESREQLLAFKTVPLELRERSQWVVWRLEQRDGKATKVPYRPDGAGRASSSDPATWSTFEAAEAAAEALAADGIGFVFSIEDPYVGVDLDAGMPESDQGAIMAALSSYSERSVSGRGFHVIVRASLNGHPRNRKGPLEMYEAGRFFVMTGEHVVGTPTTIEARQEKLEEVLAHFLPAPAPIERTERPTVPIALDDQELLEKAIRAKNGAKFERLWNGDTTGHGSHSEADLALCSLLSFWTGRDPDRIDRMFRSSGLYREKWERQDYREGTIEQAIAGCREPYSNPSQSSQPARDAVGTRSASHTAEKGETAIASPRPYVVGTQDGTRSFSAAPVSFDLRFVEAAVFAAVEEPGAAALVGTEDNVLIPEGGDVMFYGDGGAGKTTLMIDLALHLSAGDRWLGIPVGRPVRVGIVENEGPRALFRAKLRRKLRTWGGSALEDRLLLLEEPWSKVSVDLPAVREALAVQIAELELDALLVGPVTRSGMNEAGTLQQVRDYTNLLAEVRAASGRRVTFLLAHHENRGGSVSGAWEGAVDTLFHVQAQGNGQTRLLVQKARWSPEHHKQKLQLAWVAGEGFEVIDEEERDDNTVADEILEFVREHGGTGWNRVDEAVAGKGDRLRAIRDNLLSGRRLVNQGSQARMKLWHGDDPALPGERQES